MGSGRAPWPNHPLKSTGRNYRVSYSAGNCMPDKLYYDGQCPLCVKEMDRLRVIKDADLDLVDIHALDDDATPVAKDTLLRVLHMERDGEMVTGIDANIAAWEHTRYGALWRWMRLPLIRPIVELAYNRWARWRYDRLYSQSGQ